MVVQNANRCDKSFWDLILADDLFEFPQVPQIELKTRHNGMTIILDAGLEVEWSLDNGCSIDGRILCEDRSLVFDWTDIGKQIWWRVVDKGPSTKEAKLRVWTWLNMK